jgi:hypothetical protein
MHRPVLDRIGLRRVFHRHAGVHHRDGRNDLNVDLPLRTHFLWGWPALLAAAWFDLAGAGVLAACFVAHAVLWTKMHRAIHGLEENWTQALWFYGAVRRHHLEHHRRPARNFGAVFFFTDRLFRTASRPGPAARTAQAGRPGFVEGLR